MGRIIIHVGFPKVASTFLQDQLLERSDNLNVYLSKGGTILGAVDDAPHVWFDAAGRTAELKRLRDEALKSDRTTVISSESLCVGDWMISYDICEEPEVVTERIQQYLPEAEIMLILRPQSSWFASWYRQHVSGGSTHSPRSIMATPTWTERMRQALEYDRLVATYYDVFGRDRVRLFFYEDLRRDQEAFVAEVYDYFGAAAPAEYPKQALNATRSDPIIRAKLMSNRVSAFLRDQFVKSEERKKRWNLRHHVLWKYYLNRTDIVVKHFAGKRTIGSELKKELDDMYAESNGRLQELTGIDLATKGFVVSPWSGRSTPNETIGAAPVAADARASNTNLGT